MSFLWPYAWFFSLLAIPIVLLYLIRALPRRRPVSTLLFWEQIQPQLRSSPLWRKLRKILSLLFQLLFLFLLIFLLARPLLPWQNKESATVVYVIDTSASMAASAGDQSSLDAARQVLKDRIVNLRATDEVLIIAAGKSPQVIQRWTSNRRLLLERIGTIAPSESEGDLTAALDLATNLAEQREQGRVVLISDGVISEKLTSTTTVPVEVISIDHPTRSNRGLAEFSARRSRLDPQTILIRARLVQSNPTNPDEDEAKLELRVNGQLTDVLPLQFGEEPQIEKTWRIPMEGAARIEANLSSEASDAFPSDDTASLTIEAVETLAVRLVSPPNPFLEAILSSLTLVDAARILPENLPAEPGDELYLFYRSAPPEDFNPRAMVLIQPEGIGVWGETLPGSSEESLVTDWVEESDLLRHVDLDQVVFPKFNRYALPPSAETLAWSFADPVVFGDWEGENRWLATAFGLEESDLVYRTVFPILIGNIVGSLSRTSEAASAALPGETESRLQAYPDRYTLQSDETDTAPDIGFFSSLPLRNWLLILALGWTLLEWRLYHRRITE